MRSQKILLTFLASLSMINGRPQSTNTLVIQTTPSSTTTTTTSTFMEDDNRSPIMNRFHVRSDIKFRYARTTVETYVKNPSTLSREVKFYMTLPDTAFVSNFSMTLANDKEYVAKVIEKQQADDTYERAVNQGQSAAIAKSDARDANAIAISTNVEAGGKAKFVLTYEDLLMRKSGRYEHIIHVDPGQIVKDFRIEVFINESLPVVNVRVPELKSDANSITSNLKENDDVTIERSDANKAHILFEPSPETQQDDDGLRGQFIVQYDVDRKDEGNEIQVVDGYFVHFFAPTNLPVLPKHVVFVLDVSGSMKGTTLKQTKDAMVTILDDMTEKDHFNIITFSDDVYHWSPQEDDKLGTAYPGTDDVKAEALDYVLKLEANGGTNINDALLAGLNKVAEVKQSEELPGKTKSMVIFLTDGQATAGEVKSESIKNNVRAANEVTGTLIYGLAFGRRADVDLVKSISVEAKAFARRIYAAGDAAIQLEDFYAAISSPILSDVKFSYVGNNYAKTVVNDVFFDGNEFIVTGKVEAGQVDVHVEANGEDKNYTQTFHTCHPVAMPKIGSTTVSPTLIKDVDRHFMRPCLRPVSVNVDVNFVERIWAFKTLNDMLIAIEESEKSGKNETNTHQEAVDLALKYNFVSKVTSLVVTQANDTVDVVDPVPVSAEQLFPNYRPLTRVAPRPTFYLNYAMPGPPPPFYSKRKVWPAITTQRFGVASTNLSQQPTNIDSLLEMAKKVSSTTSGPPCTDGKISLFGKTYLRGRNVTIDDDVADLKTVDFDNKVTSLKVEGQCCWEIFAEANFGGKSQVFSPGEHKSASDVIQIFRRASSLKKLFQC